ncbi:MAG: glycosyl hydrolase [Pseudomonadota bacterium]
MSRIPAAVLALALMWWAVLYPGRAEGKDFFFGLALDGGPVTSDMIARAASETSLAPRMIVFFLQWPGPGGAGEFPRADLEAIEKARARPCLTWEPMRIEPDGREITIDYRDILAGKHDAYLTGFAQAARNWGRPFVMRFGHEMNLARYHWGTDREAYGPRSPGVYRAMFVYLVDLFRREKADNVQWAFCPNAESQPHPNWDGAVWNRAGAYYPGDDYVDILGMDGYNWGTTQELAVNGWDSRWMSFSEIFSDLHSELSNLSPAKPLIVFETSSARPGGDRSAWVAEALAAATAWGLEGLVWFQANKEVDWRLLPDKDGESIAAIRRRAGND